MQLRILPLGLLILAFLLTGCLTSQGVSYNVGLDQIERPSDVEERYGEYTVTEQDTTDGTKYIYEDELLSAGWLYAGNMVFMSVENKTDHSIRILLNEGAFVMPSGSSQRILTGSMSYAERNEEVQPLIIPRGASSSTYLVPADNMDFNSTTGLSIGSIIAPGALRAEDSPSTVEQNIGKTFSVLLPVQIQDTVNEYTFTFKVYGAQIAGSQNEEPQSFGDYPAR